MHVVAVAIFAFTAWLGLVAAVAYSDGPALIAAACAPLVVSGIIVALYACEIVVRLVWWLAWMSWRVSARVAP